MIIGPVASGKSTLLAALGKGPKEIRKTESLTYHQARSIDTPGEMMAIPRLYNALILNSTRASMVLMVMDGIRPLWLPARIAMALKAPVVGVITKMDQADEASADRAARSLTVAGVGRIFKVSVLTGQGMEELAAHLEAEAPGPGGPADPGGPAQDA
jgi:ethanolamine utilization protein EutP